MMVIITWWRISQGQALFPALWNPGNPSGGRRRWRHTPWSRSLWWWTQIEWYLLLYEIALIIVWNRNLEAPRLPQADPPAPACAMESHQMPIKSYQIKFQSNLIISNANQNLSDQISIQKNIISNTNQITRKSTHRSVDSWQSKRKHVKSSGPSR